MSDPQANSDVSIRTPWTYLRRYRAEANNNRVRNITVQAPRGTRDVLPSEQSLWQLATGTLDRAAWDESLSAMTSAFFELATAARPWLVKAGANGRLVGVSSFVAHAYARGLPMFPASAAAKAGIEAFARAMAVDLAPSGATANCVAPGLIEKDAAAPAALSRGPSRRPCWGSWQPI